MQRFALFSSLAFILIVGSAFALPAETRADSLDQIQAQIEDITRQRATLDAEIRAYQKQLDTLGAQHQTLQGAISTIDVSRNKTAAQIKSIQGKIAGATLKLSQLGLEITDKEQSMALDKAAVAQSIRAIDSADDASLIEQIFTGQDISEVWLSVDNLSALNSALRNHANALAEVKQVLTEQHQAVASTKTELSSANADLTSQKKSLDVQRSQKDQLLAQTKSQEANYQALIAQKRAEEKAFEATLFNLASQLKSADAALVPSAGKGVLAWPLDAVTITQYFGRTADAGRLYASGTHDGVDFAASTGTPVHAALAGTVLATNEGAVQNCQYGKWVVVKHANGLATLYAHLSSISVSKGQSVSTGGVLGYSGMTGYATGPHLHFTVYNADALAFKQYTCKSGYTVTIPIAPPNGYLDPMTFL